MTNFKAPEDPTLKDLIKALPWYGQFCLYIFMAAVTILMLGFLMLAGIVAIKVFQWGTHG